MDHLSKINLWGLGNQKKFVITKWTLSQKTTHETGKQCITHSILLPMIS